MKVGFIGLGHMGTGMATNLVKTGHEVTVYNRTAAKMQPLVELGARAADRVADACLGEAAITMVTDDTALESVAFGKTGVIANLSRGAIHVSMSTVSVALSEELTVAHADAGQGYVAAPVFGRPEAAAAAQLYIMAAGAQAAVDSCQLLFKALGAADLLFRRQASNSKPGQTQRQFPHRRGDRGLGRGPGVGGQGGRRTRPLCRFPDRNPVWRPGL